MYKHITKTDIRPEKELSWKIKSLSCDTYPLDERLESEDLFISIYLFNDERNKKKNTENVISQLEISAFIIKAPAIILRTYKYERKNISKMGTLLKYWEYIKVEIA